MAPIWQKQRRRIEFVTRSGSNEFPARYSNTFETSKLMRETSLTMAGASSFKRNQFGFLLAGPIRKDTTYVMTNFEAMRDRLTETGVYFFQMRSQAGNYPKSERSTRSGGVNPASSRTWILYPLLPQSKLAESLNLLGRSSSPPTTTFSLSSGPPAFAPGQSVRPLQSDDASSQSPQGTNLFYALSKSRSSTPRW